VPNVHVFHHMLFFRTYCEDSSGYDSKTKDIVAGVSDAGDFSQPALKEWVRLQAQIVSPPITLTTMRMALISCRKTAYQRRLFPLRPTLSEPSIGRYTCNPRAKGIFASWSLTLGSWAPRILSNAISCADSSVKRKTIYSKPKCSSGKARG
jgi:hypothetical protein